MAEVLAVAGVSQHSRRLGELGFRQGAHVQMVRRGSPCIVRLENAKLCFRECEMSHVLVRTESSS
jgi:Fe2+ transport system protein FeoA